MVLQLILQVRKRPLNKKEIGRKEEDIISISNVDSSLTVHEPKVKVCAYLVIMGIWVGSCLIFSICLRQVIVLLFSYTAFKHAISSYYNIFWVGVKCP